MQPELQDLLLAQYPVSRGVTGSQQSTVSSENTFGVQLGGFRSVWCVEENSHGFLMGRLQSRPTLAGRARLSEKHPGSHRGVLWFGDCGALNNRSSAHAGALEVSASYTWTWAQRGRGNWAAGEGWYVLLGSVGLCNVPGSLVILLEDLEVQRHEPPLIRSWKRCQNGVPWGSWVCNYRTF